jgi:hypothetical protein
MEELLQNLQTMHEPTSNFSTMEELLPKPSNHEPSSKFSIMEKTLNNHGGISAKP